MTLLPFDNRSLIDLAGRWLAEESNYQWLDFGGGRRIVTPALLNEMLQRPTHFMRAYTSASGTPIGIIALSDVNHTTGSGTMWGVTGDRSLHSRSCATVAGSAFLTLAFRELRLKVVNTWVAEHDPSRRILEQLNFRYVGRMRQCHSVEGQVCDCIFYDLLASEHREVTQEDVQGFLERQDRDRVGGWSPADRGWRDN